MRVFFEFLFIFIFSAVIIPTLQDCKSKSISFTSFLPICTPEDYCFTLDPVKSQINLFSTKTAYRAEESHDRQNDFQVKSNEHFLKFTMKT